jgi:hypothetical protein
MELFEELWNMPVKELCRKASEGSPGSIHWDHVKFILDCKVAALNIEVSQAQTELTAGTTKAADQQVKLTRALKWATIVYVCLTAIQAVLLALSLLTRRG